MIDLTGWRVGRLKVLSLGKKRQGYWYWNCLCDCGNRKDARTGHLQHGLIQSCGCLKKEQMSAVGKSRTTHGHKRGDAETPEYSTWRGMIKRCYEKKHVHYKTYGGRGITICDRWLESFENFFEDMGNRPSAKHSLDRIDNNLGYYKENCRWATVEQQMNNTSRTVMIEYKGSTKSAAQWGREFSIGTTTMHYRLKKGWSMDKIESTPVQSKSKKA